jgi:hypothetical protein
MIGERQFEVAITTTPTTGATGYQVGTSQCWGPDEAVEHVSEIALDRSMGVPIGYRPSSRAHSCVNANQGF